MRECDIRNDNNEVLTQKPWIKHYPEGVPAEIDPVEHGSIVEFFEASARRFAERPAFANMGTTLSYRQIEEQSRALANFLSQEIGLKKGERLAIILPNLLQNPVAIFGALRAGLVVVNTNPLYTPRELKHQLKDSGAAAVIVLENFAHVLAGVLPETQVRTTLVSKMGDLLNFPSSAVVNTVVKRVKKLVPPYAIPGALPFNQALKVGRKLVFQPVAITPDDLAFLQYTGGTTGVSKGAMLTHGNILANVEQAVQWITHSMPEGRQLVRGDEVVITALPLYHIFALMANCLLFVKLGGLNYLITNPRDFPRFVKELKKVRFTCMTGVNTLFNHLLNTAGFDDVDFSALKIALGGGMAVQEDVARRWMEATGTALIEAYGLTETSPAVCINPLSLAEFNGSIGLPLPSTECCVRDQRCRPLPFGEVGELCVRGPQVMKGYWNQPEETARTLSPEGWFCTGDLARIDEEGYIYLVDRKKDMILVSGFNVYPNEIEAVLSTHPGVLECGVVGVPDECTGEAVRAVVVRSDPNLDEAGLIKYCRENLAAYKIPRYVEFRDTLPKTNVGKILRRELRESVAGDTTYAV